MPHFETSDGIKIFYEIFGESGDPIIFVHPPLMGHIVFKYQRALADRYQVVMFDMRGHGQSTHHVLNSSIAQNREDLLQLLDHLGLRKAVLAGYSAAGMLAMDFALHYPHRVQALVMMGGFPKVNTWGLKQQFNIGIWLMKRKKIAFLSNVLARSHKITKNDFHEIFSYCKMADPSAVLSQYQEYLDFDCTERLPELSDVPTLVVYGEKSIHINRHHRLFQEKLSHAHIVFINHATHQIPTRFHQPFNHAIAHFLGNHIAKKGNELLQK